MSGSVRVEGLNRLVREMSALGVDITDLKGLFGDLAAKGARLAASFAPRRSGALAASVRGNKAKNKAVVKAGSAKVRYAPVQNYGWPRRGVKASLFMQRADDVLTPEALRGLDSELTRLIAARGLA